ncbi:hypothetical protein W03_01500 [Nitrosomonas sp. PY1]|uniref:hypothetical protein n=1 Tax=Nitrosomonas sp. PY1 TaxID=1803906 RepID=UPI001FC85A99|nr:hypothetical protein [Nitrosomonas sp. PY1]GKS68146.1 hypothetical protein W03_01500 [Nitrosomonas sp. PY1]
MRTNRKTDNYLEWFIQTQRYFISLTLLFATTLAFAESGDKRVLTPDEARKAEILQLERTMTRISQESQATYQEFLMTQEMRRNELAQPVNPNPYSSTSKSVPIPSYDDMIQRRKDKDDRLAKYTEDLDRLYSRYQSLETEREEIFQRIRALEQRKGEE